ncbi:MAG TPA: hypothetical protein VM890_06495 [Longimicrobium sp.]|jgi:hypothetical protein|nr:hypothetical protein [Longimicrobium sp.]
MGMLLEIGRHALEGVEVLFAFATVAALSAGMVFSHHQNVSDGDETVPHHG